MATDELLDAIIAKKKKADEHRRVAVRALASYKKHTRAQSLLEDEIMKLAESKTLSALSQQVEG